MKGENEMEVAMRDLVATVVEADQRKPIKFRVDCQISEIDFGDVLPKKIRSQNVAGHPFLMMQFVGANGQFIIIYDHRPEAVTDFYRVNGRIEWFMEEWSSFVPCLATMRFRTSLYISLARIGDPETDIKAFGKDKELCLIVLGDKMEGGCKVLARGDERAIHLPTRICLVEKLRTKYNQLAA